ncbi:MAG TPA: MarR family transcriptional regulator [Jatrophihabitans sp.]|nr:MarR family transcriptional regulator [Jatrophihabitans sp.]
MSARLPFDPVERAGQSWAKHYPEAGEQTYDAMRAVTSIMRAQQILIAGLDAALRPFNLTFSRYEALVLLTFSSTGALPLSKIGERLQVHATSVTNVIDRLESAGLVRREPNPRDGRGTLAVITEQGRQVVDRATRELHRGEFGLGALDQPELRQLFSILRRLRLDAGDFDAKDS